MNKFSVTRNGEELNPDLYTWDAKTKTFSTIEDNLVLDFSNWNGVIFRTGYRCTFKTGNGCTFDTGSGCTFNTGYRCTFKTGDNCTFVTNASSIFDTGRHCTFKTTHFCTFDTLSFCTFETGEGCTFKVGSGCKFKTKDKCIINPRLSSQVIILNQTENYYDMSAPSVDFDGITVFKNGNNLNFGIDFCNFKLETLRKLFSDQDFYAKLEREIFEKMT